MKLSAIFLLFCSSFALGYPQYISYRYASCNTCHYNPLGNGPLTDYGRGLSAVELSGTFSEEADSEKLSRNSRFLGSFGDLPNWIRLSADYRGMWIHDSLEGRVTSRYIHMQAEGSLVLQTESQDYFASITWGYAPTPRATARGKKVDNFISREHYLGARLNEQFGIYAGFMDVAFGIRVPDHNAYLRNKTLLNVNDQTHGVLLHYREDPWELALHAFTGNLYQDKSVRPWGGSFVAERDWSDTQRSGISLLHQRNSYRNRSLLEIHHRLGMFKGSSILFSLGGIHEKPISEDSTIGSFLFLQTSTMMARGLYFLTTTEHYVRTYSNSERSARVGIGAQWFPIQRVELRSDLQATRIFGTQSDATDSLSLLSQVHLWL